jgi:biotin-[acetyl-CoA-carboxylase] ligase BirA-like protein
MNKISVQWLDTCDSTSRVLRDLTRKSQFSAPTAVAAGIQTAGTGRLGQAWQSLAGNLHFSIALPPQYVRRDLRDVLPFAAAVIVARWLHRFARIRPCLKWPNDILLDGRKIAGILCEGTFQGSEFMGIVIGIGINLRHAPVLPEELSYAVGSLEGLTKHRIDPRTAAQSLAEIFGDEWPRLTRDDVMDEWTSLAIGEGHLWLNLLMSSEQHFRGFGVNESGYLRLSKRRAGPANPQTPDDEPVFSVSSASHEYKWTGQLSERAHSHVLVADVGNTQTKVALIENRKDGPLHVLSAVAGVASETSQIEFIELKIAGGAPPVVHAISVNPSGLRELKDACARIGVDVREIKKSPVRTVDSLYDMAAIGADRLALLEAVHYLRTSWEKPRAFMAVSLGTATTIDHVDSSGKHLGGYILAGLQTALDSVANRGALLPKSLRLTSAAATAGWPTTSIDAMTRATIESTIAFLNSERQRLADHCRIPVAEVQVVLSGGFSGLMRRAWATNMAQKSGETEGGAMAENLSCDENLALLGAGILAINGR